MKDTLTDPKLNILVADDQNSARCLIKHILKGQAHTLFECHNGHEAVTHYLKSPADIVIMDVTMPIMDGLTAAKLIKAHDPEAKIVIQSSYMTDDRRIQAIKNGASATLSKSDLKELPALINRILFASNKHAVSNATSSST